MKKMMSLKIAGLLIVLAIFNQGCNTGMVKTTVTEYDIPSGKIKKVTTTEDSRCTVQDKANGVGLKLRFPEMLGFTSVPTILALDLGWINNDLQNTPSGMATWQSKDYDLMLGNKIKSAQVSASEKLIQKVLEQYKLAQAEAAK